MIEQLAFWPRIGEFAIGLGLAFGILSLISSAWGARQKNQQLILAGQRSLYATTFFITCAVAILVSCLLNDNFLVRYVYGYSNSAMPIIYKLTALWGGQDGSLLFWVWLNSLFAALAVLIHRRSDTALIPYITAVFAFIMSFFLVLLIYSDNPFRLFPNLPGDGRGLNPLLQNPSMAIHPPSLYLGFVGMSVPFAFGIASLLSNRLDSRWIVATRIWTLIAWLFLSIGNLLGANWAYVELGWGGFWAWDPVENAAIMPWFTASAFLHSVMIQEKRGMLRFWNINLVVLSFCLTILGTYLTRSGVVQSVHSFAQSSIGYYFLVFLAIVIIFSGTLIYKRRKELESGNIFESFLSKESAFVLNNIILVGAAGFILYATLYPTISELISGSRIVVGPPFFNKILAPFGIALLLLTGIGPMIAWKRASEDNLKRNFTWPLVVATVAALMMIPLKLTHWYVIGTAFGAGFVLTTISMEFVSATRARIIQFKESAFTALVRSTFKNNRKFGGYIVHLGMVMIFIGIAGSVYKQIQEFDMQPGNHVTFEEYTILFKGFENKDLPNQIETYGVVDLYQGDQFLDTLKPARFFYKAQEQPSTEVALYSTVKEDVYFTLGSVDPQTQMAKIHVTINPLISWLWMGGVVLILGGLLSMMPSNLGRRRV